jgi:bifunctional non-homologous end joining protein LigD
MAKALPAKISFIEPMYALAIRKLPEGPDWLYEIKFDGYRCLAGKDGGGVSLWSRRGNDFTSQFPAIARACEALRSGTLVDGEIVALDSEGRISFNMMQHHRRRASAICLYVFDILTISGRNILNEILLERRDALTDMVRPALRLKSQSSTNENPTTQMAQITFN